MENQQQSLQGPQQLVPPDSRPPNIAVLVGAFVDISRELLRFGNLPPIADARAMHNQIDGLQEQMRGMQERMQDLQASFLDLQLMVLDIRRDQHNLTMWFPLQGPKIPLEVLHTHQELFTATSSSTRLRAAHTIEVRFCPP